VTRIARETEAANEQSGDLQGLSNSEDADSESVRELVEEGQYFEAAVVSGVEDAPDADAGPIRVHKRKEDDLPPEYTDNPPDEPKE
jgi:hypothetical protein